MGQSLEEFLVNFIAFVSQAKARMKGNLLSKLRSLPTAKQP